MVSRFVIFTVFTAALLNSCGSSTKGKLEDTAEETVKEQTYKIGQVLNLPNEIVNKVIKIEGTVTHVCKHSGKRLHLKNLETNEMIRIEAGDKIVRFERELEGSDIVVTGSFRKQVIDESYINEISKESHGENHDHGEESEGEERAKNMRKMLSESGKDQMIIYWVDGISFEEI
jgi:hypothetical protein